MSAAASKPYRKRIRFYFWSYTYRHFSRSSCSSSFCRYCRCYGVTAYNGAFTHLYTHRLSRRVHIVCGSTCITRRRRRRRVVLARVHAFTTVWPRHDVPVRLYGTPLYTHRHICTVRRVTRASNRRFGFDAETRQYAGAVVAAAVTAAAATVRTRVRWKIFSRHTRIYIHTCLAILSVLVASKYTVPFARPILRRRLLRRRSCDSEV